MKSQAPSPSFRAFADPLGPVVSTYDQWGQVLLFPSLIAARGRARSFEAYRNAAGQVFNAAECHFVEGPHCDGQAARRSGQFFFAIYDAVAYQMLDLFSLAFACPTFLAELGDASREDAARVTAREKPAGYGLFRRDAGEPLRFDSDLAFPRCPIRQQAALLLTGMALDAVWTHELAHAFMGHLDYAEKELGIRALNETPNRGGDLRQMPLEAEADRFAGATLVQSAFARLPYLPTSLAGLDAKLRVRSGFVVAAMITWFWAYQQRIDRTLDGMDPYTQGSHPPPLARLHLSYDGGRDMLRNLGWAPAEIQAVTFDAMSDLDALADAKNWFSILRPAHAFSEASNSFVRDVKQIIGDTFRDQQEALEPLRYVKPPTA